MDLIEVVLEIPKLEFCAEPITGEVSVTGAQSITVTATDSLGNSEDDIIEGDEGEFSIDTDDLNSGAITLTVTADGIIVNEDTTASGTLMVNGIMKSNSAIPANGDAIGDENGVLIEVELVLLALSRDIVEFEQEDGTAGVIEGLACVDPATGDAFYEQTIAIEEGDPDDFDPLAEIWSLWELLHVDRLPGRSIIEQAGGAVALEFGSKDRFVGCIELNELGGVDAVGALVLGDRRGRRSAQNLRTTNRVLAFNFTINHRPGKAKVVSIMFASEDDKPLAAFVMKGTLTFIDPGAFLAPRVELPVFEHLMDEFTVDGTTITTRSAFCLKVPPARIGA